MDTKKTKLCLWMIWFILLLALSPNHASQNFNSIEVTNARIPRNGSRIVVGYDEANDTFLLFGGTGGGQYQFVSFKNNTFTDHGTNYITDTIYKDQIANKAQAYTQTDTILWMMDKQGFNILRVDTETRDITYPTSTTLPQVVSLDGQGCLTSYQIGNNQYLFVVGGYDWNIASALDLIQVYNINNGTWLDTTNIPKMQQARLQAACAVHGSTLYGIGGVDPPNAEYLNFGDNLIDIESNQWQYVDGNLSAYTESRAAVHGDNIFVVGGLYVREVHVINTITNTVTVQGSLARPVASPGIIVINDVLYLFGGEKCNACLQFYINTYQYINLLSDAPTPAPTDNPVTSNPTFDPTTDPTIDPTSNPTPAPTSNPTQVPTSDPTIDPTVDPTFDPTQDPTTDPTTDPTSDPTTDPTYDPTVDPTFDPTQDPTSYPTTSSPTMYPTTSIPTYTKNPTIDPTIDPTMDPTIDPTMYPTPSPTTFPSKSPTNIPTKIATTTSEGGSGVVESTIDSKDGGEKNKDEETLQFFQQHLLLLIFCGIGSILCCITCFIAIYFKKKKRRKLEKNAEQMELARITSTSEINIVNDTASSPTTTTVATTALITTSEPAAEPFSNSEALKMWLTNIDLIEYYDMFIENGFGEGTAELFDLNNEDLKDMGIKKVRHRKMILKQINNNKENIVSFNNLNLNNKEKGEEEGTDGSSDALFEEALPDTVTCGGIGYQMNDTKNTNNIQSESSSDDADNLYDQSNANKIATPNGKKVNKVNNGFYARAIADYDNNGDDSDDSQLILKKNGIFWIVQSLESGWCYGIDEMGLDGWIPSNYIKKLDRNELKQLKQEQKRVTDDGNNNKYKKMIFDNILPPKIPPPMIMVTTDAGSY